MSEYGTTTYATLSCGLRVVHRQLPGLTEYAGVAINAGSRDENPDEHGLAHFVEHTIFKGTSRHTANYVLNRMEAVGGELNAYTTKEETMLYAAMPAGNMARAIALIAELVTDSQFPDRQLDHEREVIADEIDSYLDSPSERVYDRFEDIFFDGNPLGHNILGTKDSITAFNSESCRDWLRRYYTAPNMVLYYLGPASAPAVLRVAERHFQALSGAPAPLCRTIPSPPARFHNRENHDNHQSHCVMGTTIPGMHSPDRYAMALALNILGGPGMNARLNVSLRERRGLVYTVETSTTLLSDTGLATIYFGCDHDDTARCRKLVANELDRMASCELSSRALEAARRQFIGQLTLGHDNKEQQALNMGRATLYYGHAAEPGDTARHIQAITPQALQQAGISLTDSLNHCLILE